MITSRNNEKLKLIRRLAERKHRERDGLFVAEGEDLVDAAAAAGVRAEFVLRAGEDVEPRLLDSVSALGSGARVIAVYRRAWGSAQAGLRVYLHGVGDPGNVGAILRTAHALADAPVVIGPGCADPFGPKAVRASMGSVFARPPLRGGAELLTTPLVGLVAHGAEAPDDEPVGTLALGSERDGLPADVLERCDRRWTIPLVEGTAESLNVAAAAAIALGRISSAAPGQAPGGQS
jgi:TrmH family RNA methyltransferase